MSGNIDLSSLKEYFKDDRDHISIGLIKKLDLASDNSNLKVLVSIFPEQREFVAKMTWETVGSGSGYFQFPSVNDLVLVAFANGDVNQCFVIKRLTSKEDKIPIQAVGGDSALISLGGKRAWICSDNKIFLAKGSAVPTEPIVLGNVLKTLLSDIIGKISEMNDKISTHKHIGNLGFPTGAPDNATNFIDFKSHFDGKKASPVDDNVMLSDLAFTEKG